MQAIPRGYVASHINAVIVNRNGKAYVYGLNRRLSDLFVVSSLK